MKASEESTDNKAILNAIHRSLGVIEFGMDGIIIAANKNFLDIVGYSLDELKGKHHKLLCEEAFANSPDYKIFWDNLSAGKIHDGEYKRIGKNGKAVYIQATYNPIFDEKNKATKIIKFATDVTIRKLMNAEHQGKIDAIDKSLGTIEFNMDGTIITANENFLDMINYSLDEIKGRHHRILCEESYSNSPEYEKFWEKLKRGEFDRGEYKRIGKNGAEISIRATYNPIFDLSGKPVRVLKLATDISEQKRLLAERIKQAALIMEMSTPVMQLWENILLLPVVGLVDSKRVQLIMQTALQKIMDYQAKVLILDIQGVPAVDSAVANHLIQITKATSLMGCTCIVTGISPEIAQSLVNLGIDLGDILTQANLKDGVRTSLKTTGFQLRVSEEVN
ncbi:MAG: methyl-accepting chemotaxis protein, partial [Pseudohongiellaceae bacterium]|jgi:methyl-accepting chemotaxis protein